MEEQLAKLKDIKDEDDDFDDLSSVSSCASTSLLTAAVKKGEPPTDAEEVKPSNVSERKENDDLYFNKKKQVAALQRSNIARLFDC